MRRWLRPTLAGTAALILTSVAGCATLGGPTLFRRTIPTSERVDALLTEPPFDGVQWGVYVVQVDGDDLEVLYERNAAVRFIPASNMKLPVTVAAMGLLGPSHFWETPFLAPSFPEGGVIQGDLIFVGSGDPTLGEPFYESVDEALDALVSVVEASGVDRVTGALVLDASRWDSASVPSSWMVEDLVATAGATGGAFALARGELEIRVTGSRTIGQPALVDWSPMGAPSFVESTVVTEGPDASTRLAIEYLVESRHWRLTGAIGSEREDTLTVPARDPVRLAVDALERAMEDRGIVVEGGVRILWERGLPVSGSCSSGSLMSCTELVWIGARTSPPLSEVIAAILGPSQNWMAEQLVRSLGDQMGSAGSWPAGFQVLREYLRGSVDSLELRMEDASGLSAKNLMSPRAVVTLLGLARGPWFYTYLAGMARPGGVGTTLDNRLAGLEGRVFAKTGSISNVNSLSGYLLREDGRELIFSILSNGSNLSATAVSDRIDLVVRELARSQD